MEVDLLSQARGRHHGRRDEADRSTSDRACWMPRPRAFQPKRFTEQASASGLNSGFAVDLSEQKPYGPEKGKYWDLSLDGCEGAESDGGV